MAEPAGPQQTQDLAPELAAPEAPGAAPGPSGLGQLTAGGNQALARLMGRGRQAPSAPPAAGPGPRSRVPGVLRAPAPPAPGRKDVEISRGMAAALRRRTADAGETDTELPEAERPVTDFAPAEAADVEGAHDEIAGTAAPEEDLRAGLAGGDEFGEAEGGEAEGGAAAVEAEAGGEAAAGAAAGASEGAGAAAGGAAGGAAEAGAAGAEAAAGAAGAAAGEMAGDAAAAGPAAYAAGGATAAEGGAAAGGPAAYTAGGATAAEAGGATAGGAAAYTAGGATAAEGGAAAAGPAAYTAGGATAAEAGAAMAGAAELETLGAGAAGAATAGAGATEAEVAGGDAAGAVEGGEAAVGAEPEAGAAGGAEAEAAAAGAGEAELLEAPPPAAGASAGEAATGPEGLGGATDEELEATVGAESESETEPEQDEEAAETGEGQGAPTAGDTDATDAMAAEILEQAPEDAEEPEDAEAGPPAGGEIAGAETAEAELTGAGAGAGAPPAVARMPVGHFPELRPPRHVARRPSHITRPAGGRRLQRGILDTITGAAGSALSWATSNLLRPMQTLGTAYLAALPTASQRIGQAAQEANPGVMDIFSPHNLMIRMASRVRQGIFADAIAQERSERAAAEAAGTPREGAQVEPGPIERIDAAASSVEEFAVGATGIQKEIVEGAILGDFKENPSGWNTLGQIAIGFVPYAGQVADVRDLVATVGKLHKSGWKDPWEWFNLVLTIVAFVPGIGDAIKAVGRGAKGMIQKGVRWIGKTAPKIWRAVGKAIPAIGRGLKAFGSRIARGIGSVASKLLGKAKSFGSSLMTKARGALNAAKGFIRGVGDRVRGIAQGIASGAKSILARGRSLFSGAVSAIMGRLRSAFDTVAGAARRGIEAAKRGLTSVREGLGKITQRIGQKLTQARQYVTDLARNARQRATALYQNARRWIAEKKAWVADKITRLRAMGVRGVVNWLKNGVKSVKDRFVNWVKAKLGPLKDRVTTWLKDQKDKVLQKVKQYHTPHQRRTHIIDGDATGGPHSGKHSDPTLPDNVPTKRQIGGKWKSLFPRRWTDDEVISAIEEAARRTHGTRIGPQWNGNFKHPPVSVTRNGVTCDVVVISKPDGRVWTAWPVV